MCVTAFYNHFHDPLTDLTNEEILFSRFPSNSEVPASELLTLLDSNVRNIFKYSITHWSFTSREKVKAAHITLKIYNKMQNLYEIGNFTRSRCYTINETFYFFKNVVRNLSNRQIIETQNLHWINILSKKINYFHTRVFSKVKHVRRETRSVNKYNDVSPTSITKS